MKLRLVAALWCASGIIAFGQGVRYDNRAATVQTNMPAGANAPVLAIPNAKVLICITSDCLTPATIYQDQALTVVAPNPITTGGATPANLGGSWGFWASSGTYWYKITTTQGIVYGPYPFTLGGSGSGGGSVSSVFGRAGTVVAQANDYNFSQIAGTVAATQLPAATITTLGAVKPDGISINVAAGAVSVPSGSNSAFGLLKCDGTTISCTGGVATAIGGGGSVTGTGASGYLTCWTSATNLTQCLADYGVTAASRTTFSGTDGVGAKKYYSTDTSGVGFGMIGNQGTQPTCTGTQSGWWADSTSNTIRPCNNGSAASFMFTTTSVTAAQMPALTGDATSVAGTVALTLATVNTNTGSCGDATHVCQVTLDGKGRATAATSVSITGSGGIANFTVALPTSAIAAGACTTAATATATGAATTTSFWATPNADITAVTGWAPGGGLRLYYWPTANTFNYRVCNENTASVTPGAVTINVAAK